jgi:hypothetical protein
MLAIPGPRKKDRPLRDAVYETIKTTSTDSIPAYVDRGIANLAYDAAEIRALIKEEELQKTRTN